MAGLDFADDLEDDRGTLLERARGFGLLVESALGPGVFGRPRVVTAIARGRGENIFGGCKLIQFFVFLKKLVLE